MFGTFLSLPTKSPLYGFYENLKSIVEKDSRTISVGDNLIRPNQFWLRDHIHEMKGYIYWEPDVQSFLNLILENQTQKGFFYEILAQDDFDHFDYVGDDNKKLISDTGYGLIRLEVEADIEYLVVEGAYRAWQATGDTEWICKNVDHCEKALKYITSDPKRWDSKYQLVKRPRTIDTWDFIDRSDSGTNRRILPEDPMGIMHGDNSGTYNAMILLSKMYSICGNNTKTTEWHENAEQFRQRANKLLWNGKYYIHHFNLDSTNYGIDERKQISLSNAYDINRRLSDHKMAVSIIDEYIKLKQSTKDEYFAEWFSLYPPYKKFFVYSAGEYINGGIASFVAGELAHASFEHGREYYAVDILKRISEKMQKDGTLYFLYDKNGNNLGGGPSGWGAASLIYALIEGLAGVKDNGCGFEKVELSPRWVAANEHEAHIRTMYGASGKFLEYDFQWNKEDKKIILHLYSEPKEIEWNILLPEKCNLKRVSINKNSTDFSIETIEDSHYVTFTQTSPIDTEIILDYEQV